MSDYSVKDHIAYKMGFKAGQESQADRIAELEEELSIWRSVFPDIAPERVLPDRRLLLDRIAELEAALATARRDALALIKQDTDELIEQARKDGMEYAAQIADNYANRNHVSLNIGVVIRAALKGGKKDER
jgi:hypothetical protein